MGGRGLSLQRLLSDRNYQNCNACDPTAAPQFLVRAALRVSAHSFLFSFKNSGTCPWAVGQKPSPFLYHHKGQSGLQYGVKFFLPGSLSPQNEKGSLPFPHLPGINPLFLLICFVFFKSGTIVAKPPSHLAWTNHTSLQTCTITIFYSTDLFDVSPTSKFWEARDRVWL